MRVKFHGARGSHPVCATPHRISEILENFFKLVQSKKIESWPQALEEIAKLPRAEFQIYGGHTTCVELKSEFAPMPVFFDAGTGITAAGVDKDCALTTPAFFKGAGKAAIFFSHTHWDHLIGLITLEQLYKGNEFHFYGVHKNIKERLMTLFDDRHFPVPFHVVEPYFKFHQIPLNTPMQFGGLSINHCPQSHPGGSFAYRVSDGKKTFVFATDTELKNIDPPHMEPGDNTYSDADVLVLDAQYSPEEFRMRQGYGHSQIFQAVDLAVRERVKFLYLFHHNPGYTDSEIDQQLDRSKAYLKEKYSQSKMSIAIAIEGQEIVV
jgi:ribonuclease BN (tRNA processing enzyme)